MGKTRPKDIGTKFETECVKTFREFGFDARRLALGGSNDNGDIELITDQGVCVVECKCYKSWCRGDIREWREQTLKEFANYQANYGNTCSCALIVSQYRKSKFDSYVHVVQNGVWVQMYLDEFIDFITPREGMKCR